VNPVCKSYFNYKEKAEILEVKQALRAAIEPAERVAEDSLLAEARERLLPFHYGEHSALLI
jgi:hypothetical protein